MGGSFSGNIVSGISDLMEIKPLKYANKLESDGLKKVTSVSESDIVKVDSGDKMNIGNIEVEFLHTPGHTPEVNVSASRIPYQRRHFYQRLRTSRSSGV